jgi:hypothetical protein
MKAIKFFLSLFFAFVVSAVIGESVETVTGLSSYAVGGAAFAASFIPKPAGILPMALNVEIWHNFISENLYANNAFLQKSVDVSGNVLAGKIVHIPNAGAPSNVQRNRTNLPAQVKRRKDVDVVYALDEFTSDPILITNAETVELSYDKVGSVLANDMSNLRQNMSIWMLYNWFTGANVLKTTGSAVSPHITGTTGNKKAVTLADIEALQARFDEDEIPMEGRTVLFDAQMYRQFVSSLVATEYKDFSSYFNAATGVVGRLFGFDFMKRSRVSTLKNDFTLLSPDDNVAATALAGAVAWQDTTVERAVGTISMFESKGDPTYYGDVYSFLVRAGGRARRADGKGVYILSQDNA